MKLTTKKLYKLIQEQIDDATARDSTVIAKVISRKICLLLIFY